MLMSKQKLFEVKKSKGKAGAKKEVATSSTKPSASLPTRFTRDDVEEICRLIHSIIRGAESRSRR